MFVYRIRLSLAETNSALNLYNHENFIKNTISEYNKKRKNNPKEISKVQITSPSTIECTVESRMELFSVGRGIKNFTGMLCQNEEFRNSLNLRSQLFSCEVLSTTKYDSDKLDVSSDWQLVHALIDFVAKPVSKRNSEQQEAFDLIKKIAKESNIIV